VSGAYGVQAFFRFRVDMGGDNLTDKDYMVAGGYLRFECAFEIGDRIGQQQRINCLGRLCFAIELCEFIDVPAGLRAEE